MHFGNPRKSFCILVVSFIGLASVARAVSPPVHTPFVSVVLADFDKWDTNHDGTLSVEEVDKVVVDPSVKGDDAAAAGALKLLSRSKKNPLPPLTKDFFLDYDKKALALMAKHGREPVDAIGETTDTVATGSTTQPAARSAKLPADFDLYFKAGKDRIARGGPVPFTGRFVLEDTRQGPLGDCFFVSSISSLAFHDPARFEKLIVPQKDGGYVVNIPNTQPITVPAPTDAELAISSTTAGDGIWLAIMEQAFGKYKARLKGQSEDDVEGTDVLRTGGDSKVTITQLTGHECSRISFAKTVEARQTDADKVLPRLRKELTTALADHRAITAGVLSHPATTKPAEGTPTPVPPNISTNHVYAVLSYDPATDIVEIWNPHGQHYEPKGPPGIKNGYATDHGRFKLPLTEAYQFYSSFTFELATPAKKTAESLQ